MFYIIRLFKYIYNSTSVVVSYLLCSTALSDLDLELAENCVGNYTNHNPKLSV